MEKSTFAFWRKPHRETLTNLQEKGRWALIAAVLALSGANTACARAPEPSAIPRPSPSPRVVSAPTQPPLGVEASSSPDNDDNPVTTLGRALMELQRGTRHGPVRVVWMGDSHTAADFWTGEVRRLLQERFGDGGPGFVPVGLSGVRHEGVTIKTFGKWRQEPKIRAASHLQLDGRFGLAGRRSVAEAGAGVVVRAKRNYPRLRWDVHHRGSYSARVRMQAGESDRTELRSVSGQGKGTDWQVVSLASQHSEVRIQVQSGQVQLLGLFGEATPPGIVLDALGINGARLATLLSWDQQDWVAHLQDRAPHLVVLAYGTNEAGDAVEVNKYYAGYERIVTHIRSSGATCLMMGPTDRQDRAGNTLERVEVLDQFIEHTAGKLGCIFFSPFQAMGGNGGFAHWRNQSPPLAARDGVHLTVSGYQEMARLFVEFLLAVTEATNRRL